MAVSAESTRAILRFKEPNFYIGPEDRSLFALCAATRVVDAEINLHDARNSAEIAKGAAGLDVQGFTYVKHRSALANSNRPSESWFEGQNLEDVYFPEVCKLICDLTGAKRAIVNNSAFRRKLANEQADPTHYLKRDCDLDKEIQKLPKDIPFAYGKQGGGSLEPARPVHVDYTSEGLRRTARDCRHDIREVAREALDAEDARGRGEDVSVPRYAAYSVWRPIKTVKRDPLAVADCRTLDKSELMRDEYRALSDNAKGEYMMENWVLLPPKEKGRAKYYWLPEQQPDEVLILKFADTQADEDPNVAMCCAHGAAEIPGTEEEEPRMSIECRVLAFW